jgi:hypothetical protein
VKCSCPGLYAAAAAPRKRNPAVAALAPALGAVKAVRRGFVGVMISDEAVIEMRPK